MLNPITLFNLSYEERLQILNIWYKELYFHWYDPLTYFSVWNIILDFIITKYLNDIPIFYKLKMNVLLQTFIGGFYITYINPRYIKIPYLNLIITDSLLYIIDFFSHQIPFFYSLFYKEENILISWSDFIIINIPILFYIRFFPIYLKYNIKELDLLNLFIIYIFILYFFT